MNIGEFQKVSLRTMKIDENTISHCSMGLAGETGEVIDIIKKHLYYEKELDKNHITEELGDIMFYLVNLASALDISMVNVLEQNIEKLNKRYPEGFNKEDAILRRDKSE